MQVQKTMPLPYGRLKKNEALAQYGFEAANPIWGWGGRNAAEGSVCFLNPLYDATPGPELCRATVNLWRVSDFLKGGNGFNDRMGMVHEMTRGSTGYVLLYEPDKDSKLGDGVKHVYAKLYVIVALVEKDGGEHLDAIIEAA